MTNLKDLCFLICWWNDPSIIRLLDSLPTECTKIIVDGKFKETDSKMLLSDDVLRGDVQKYNNVQLLDAPNLTEVEKRNICLEQTKGFRYGIMMDSEEWIGYVNWKLFFEQMDQYDHGFVHVPIELPDKPKTYLGFARIIITPYEWRHFEAHFAFKHTITGELFSNKLFLREPLLFVDVIELKQNDNLRDKNYRKTITEYQKKLHAKEQIFVTKYSNMDTN